MWLNTFLLLCLSLGVYTETVLEKKAKLMEELINPKIDPCEDFWGYVGGRLVQTKVEEIYAKFAHEVFSSTGKLSFSSGNQIRKSYAECVRNPENYRYNTVQTEIEDAQIRKELEHLTVSVAKANLTDDREYLSLLQQAYYLNFQYGGECFERFLALASVRALFLPLGSSTTRMNSGQTNLKKVANETEFMAGIFGKHVDVSGFYFLTIPFPKDENSRRIVLDGLSMDLQKTLENPPFYSCEIFFLRVFPMHFVKMAMDHIGMENIGKIDQLFRSDLDQIRLTVQVALENSNVLSETMRTTMLGQLKKQKFYGLDKNPILENATFKEFFSDIKFDNLFFRRHVNNIKPLMLAAGGKNPLYYFVPQPESNAYHLDAAEHNYFYLYKFLTPNFDRSFPSHLRFSGIGLTAAHELGHGFDKNSPIVNLDPTYTQLFDCMYEMYNSKCNPAEPSTCLDPKFNINENFGDIFGAQMTYLTYKRNVAMNGVGQRPRGKILDGLSDDQLFFLNLGQTVASFAPEWRESFAPEVVHSPGPTRLWGALAGLRAFSNAFNCSSQSRYYYADSCRLYDDVVKPNYNLTVG